MAVTATSVRAVRRDVWHRRFGPALALGLVVLPFAAALVWTMSLSPVDHRALAESIRSTAVLVDEHAAVMIRIGERIGSTARASDAPSRETWIAYGGHLVSDGRGLEDLAARLRKTAVVAEADPMHRGRVDVAGAILQARWEQLRADGRATALHGGVMAEQARAMGGAPSGIAGAADLVELEQASVGMAEAGERTVRVAEMLLGSVSQMQRWLGISR